MPHAWRRTDVRLFCTSGILSVRYRTHGQKRHFCSQGNPDNYLFKASTKWMPPTSRSASKNVIVLVLPVIAFVGDVGAAEGELHATTMISATTRN
jgi:hypothetical protein